VKLRIVMCFIMFIFFYSHHLLILLISPSFFSFHFTHFLEYAKFLDEILLFLKREKGSLRKSYKKLKKK
jgi:hypothetical protein